MKNTLALNYWVMGGFEGIMKPEAAIDTVKAWDLDGVELTFGDCLAEDISVERLEKIRDHAKKRGVALRTLATGNYWNCSLSSVDEIQRKQATEFTRKYIDAAAIIGAETVLITAGSVDVAWDASVPVIPYKKVWDKATESISALIPYAEDKGVRLGVENVWSKFLLSPVEARNFVDQFDSPYLGIYFDTGNVEAFGYPEHWIPVLSDKIFAVHVKNFSRSDSLGGLHGFGDDLLQGDVNFKAVMRELENIGYTGPLTAEMIPFCRLPDMILPDMQLAEDTARKLKSIFGVENG